MNKLKPRRNSNNQNLIFLIFDSECAMCCTFIRWLDLLYKNSKYKLYIVSSLENLLNSDLSKYLYLDNSDIEYIDSIRKKTIIYIDQKEKLLIKSKAIFILLNNSGNFLCKLLTKIFSLFPYFILDKIYNLISKNRMKISSILNLNKNCVLKYQHIFYIG